MDDDDGFKCHTSSHKKATATGSGPLTSTKPKAQHSLPTINDEDDEESYLRWGLAISASVMYCHINESHHTSQI